MRSIRFTKFITYLIVGILIYPNFASSAKRQFINPTVSAYITKGTRIAVCGALLVSGMNALVPDDRVSATAAGYGLPKIVTDKADFLQGQRPSLSRDSSPQNMALQSLTIFAGQVSHDGAALIENVPTVARRIFRLTADELILLTGTSAELVNDLTKELKLDNSDRIEIKEIQLQPAGIGLIELA